MIANSPAAWSERAKLNTSWDAAMWSPEGQQARFAAVLEALAPRAGETLLDFGCGTGSLFDHLPDTVGYTGFDWSAGMIKRALLDHPGSPPGRFFSNGGSGLPGPLSYAYTPTYDLIACIGPFNLRDGWSRTETWNVLNDLWGRTGRALAACLYAGEDPACLAYTMNETSEFAAAAGARHTARKHLPNDILLVMERST